MIDHLDHLVLTVRDLDATLQFYTRVLGMEEITFGDGRKALRFGNQKINLHEVGAEFSPHARRPTPGSADLCFLTSEPLERVHSRVLSAGTTIVDGPVERTGAVQPIRSLYLWDPDGNLIEISIPIEER